MGYKSAGVLPTIAMLLPGVWLYTYDCMYLYLYVSSSPSDLVSIVIISPPLYMPCRKGQPCIHLLPLINTLNGQTHRLMRDTHHSARTGKYVFKHLRTRLSILYCIATFYYYVTKGITR